MKSFAFLAGVFGATIVCAQPPAATSAAVKESAALPPEDVHLIFANTVIAEIQLANGETLTHATFLNAGAAGANFAVDRSIRTIPYALLPTDLAKRTSLFAAQASAAEAARVANRRDTQEQVRTAHVAAVGKVQQRAAQNLQDSQNQMRDEDVAARQEQSARFLAQTEAYDYFKHEWKPGNDSVYVTSISVKVAEVEPRSGWEGEWDVNGEAFIRYYISSGNSFSSMNVRFSAVMKEKGSYPHFVPTLF